MTARNGLQEPIVTGVDPNAIMKMMGVKQGIESQACGTIGLVSQELARFTVFWLSWQALMRPATTKYIFRQGMDVTSNYNGLVNDMAGDWLLIMGDDHTFPPDLLVRLLAHDVDVIVPLVLKRHAPFDPVVYGDSRLEDDGQVYHQVADLPQHGLVEIHAAGSAGMLVKRKVFDAIKERLPNEPVFTTSPGIQNEDLLFCKKVRETIDPETGEPFKIWCDVDTRMGHISVFGVYPMWQGRRYGAALDLGGGQFTPMFAFTDDELAELEAEMELEATKP